MTWQSVRDGFGSRDWPACWREPGRSGFPQMHSGLEPSGGSGRAYWSKRFQAGCCSACIVCGRRHESRRELAFATKRERSSLVGTKVQKKRQNWERRAPSGWRAFSAKRAGPNSLPNSHSRIRSRALAMSPKRGNSPMTGLASWTADAPLPGLRPFCSPCSDASRGKPKCGPRKWPDKKHFHRTRTAFCRPKAGLSRKAGYHPHH